MGEIDIEGPRARELLDRRSRTTSRESASARQHTLPTNQRGGIVDDPIVYQLDQCRSC
jgi:glycine cleavage system aminomethyltransferase T